jgi:hypothetical protein
MPSMAEAIKKEVQVLVTTPVMQERVELCLTTKEAEVLRAILERIGGQPSGPRGLADNMANVLRKADVALPNLELEYRDLNRAIYFAPNKEYING